MSIPLAPVLYFKAPDSDPLSFDDTTTRLLIDTEVDGLDAFELTERGVVWTKITNPNSENPITEKVLICGPLIAYAKTRDLAQPNMRGLLLWFKDQSKTDHHLPISRGDIQRPAGILKMLYELDFYVNRSYEKQLALYLSKMSPKETRDYVTQTGWTREHQSFALPHGLTVSRDIEGQSLGYLSSDRHSSLLKSFRPGGTYENWKHQVAARCLGNPLPIFALATAFAGPLLRPLNMDSFCVHLYHKTSRGKTTTQQIAASVWGVGADPARQPGDTFLIRWNSTENALGRQASFVNDTLLVIDEVGNFEGDDFGRVIYSFLGGTSKSGLTPSLRAREPHHWRIVALSTGEKSGQSLIERNRVAMGGQLNRFLDIPCGETLFPETGGVLPGAFADDLKMACATHFGWAGPEFLRGLLDHTESHFDLINRLNDWFKRSQDAVMSYALTLITPTPEQERALRRFAFIQTAGEIAVSAGCLPFPVNVIGESVRVAIAAWLDAGDTSSDGDRMIEAIRNYLTRHQTHFIEVTEIKETLTSSQQVIGYHRNGEFLLTEESFTKACGDHDPRGVRQELARLGYLVTTKETVKGVSKLRYKSRFTVPTVVGKKSLRLYAIKMDILQS